MPFHGYDMGYFTKPWGAVQRADVERAGFVRVLSYD